MPSDPREPPPPIVERLVNDAIAASIGLPHADQLFIGAQLLTVITIAARAMLVLEDAHPDAQQLDRLIANASNALENVGAALRGRGGPLQFPRR